MPLVMGILNVTPDSFSDGGRYRDCESALAHARALIKAGANIIDIGGESTRPGAVSVEAAEEMARVLPVIEKLARESDVTISIDTRKADVMIAAVGAGARMINDVSALTYDANSLTAAASLGVPVVLMHAKGTPQDMQKDPRYDDVVGEVYEYLRVRIEAAEAAGIARAKLIVDPGIGFGKTLGHNLALLREIGRFHELGCPLLVGVSRKNFLSQLAGGYVPVSERLSGSLACALWLATQGVNILRVHDVGETVQALGVWAALDTTDGVLPVSG